MNLQTVRQQYPQYDDLSDEQLATALHGKFYSDMPMEEFSAKIGLAAPAPEPPARPISAEIPRQLGLTGRAIGTGLSAIPTMIGDAANSAINLGTRGVNKLTGSNIPPLQMPSEMVQRGMTAVGVPQPETMQEHAVQAGGSALTGAGGLGTLARLGGSAAPLLKMLASAPAAQVTGAAAGALGTEYARRQGVENPLALTAIGMVSGAGPGLGKSAIGRPLGAIGALAKPFTGSGREVIAGKALNRLATTPQATAERLAQAEPIIPGSDPTVSQVSQDPGLMGAESALRGMDERNLIGNRQSQQNRARQEALYTVAGDEGTVQGAQRYQKQAYDELAAPAFAKKQPIQIGREWINNPVKRTIQDIRETPAGARKSVKDALDEAEAQLTQPGVDLSDAETLYEIRKDLALARDGKLVGKGASGAELSNLKTARKQLNTVIDSLDNVIEQGAPGFKNYLKVFHERSIPLDQLRAAQALRARSETAVMDQATGTPILGTRFGKIFRDNLDKGLNLRGKGPKAGNMTPAQIGILKNVADDIDRGAAAQAATVRSPGSDTFKNLSIANVIGRILGDADGALISESTTAKSLYRPLSFLYQVPDQAMQQLMIEAWLDPKLASRLMKQATQHEVESLATELGNRLNRQTAAAALYGSGP